MSPPAVSRSISRLEEQLGVELFERAGRGVRLTSYGHALLGRAQRILDEVADTRRALRDLRDAEAAALAPIALGFFATLGTRVVPSLVRRYHELHLEARFALIQGSAVSLHRRLLAGEVDVCLSSPNFDDARIGWHPLWSQELVAMVPPGSVFAQRAHLDLAELARERFVALDANYGLRRVLDGLCAEAGFSPDVIVQAEEVATLVGLVRAGFGVTLAPPEALGGGVCGIPVRTPRCHRTFGLSWLLDRYLSPQAATFRDFTIGSIVEFAKPCAATQPR